jgi:hypothetical protein
MPGSTPVNMVYAMSALYDKCCGGVLAESLFLLPGTLGALWVLPLTYQPNRPDKPDNQMNQPFLPLDSPIGLLGT